MAAAAAAELAAAGGAGEGTAQPEGVLLRAWSATRPTRQEGAQGLYVDGLLLPEDPGWKEGCVQGEEGGLGMEAAAYRACGWSTQAGRAGRAGGAGRAGRGGQDGAEWALWAQTWQVSGAARVFASRWPAGGLADCCIQVPVHGAGRGTRLWDLIKPRELRGS